MALLDWGRARGEILLVSVALGAGCVRDNPAFDEAKVGSGDTGDASSTGTTRGIDSTAEGTTTAGGPTSSGETSLSTSGPSDTGNLDDGIPPGCGDGVLDDGEECDAGQENAPDGTCFPDCTKNICGDGIKAGGEACDDGNDDETDACTTACHLAACGDGHVNGNETCEEGAVPLACSDLGYEAGEATCVACQWKTAGCHTCGDGVKHQLEQCDTNVFDGFNCQDNADLVGSGSVSCSNECKIVVEGDCCAEAGLPCPFGLESMCCSGFCEQGTCVPG